MNAKQICQELQQLGEIGEKLVPHGGSSIGGYNGSMQSEYAAWRANAISVIEELGKSGTRLIREIENDQEGPYFYMGAAERLLGIVKGALLIAQRNANNQSSNPSTSPKSAEVPFVSYEHIEQLRISIGKFDLARFVRHCEEINSAYESGNLISVLLLIRSLMNHIPPLFGATNFASFVSQSGKSAKDILLPLETELRSLADHYTHDMIKHKAPLPTKGMIDPFQARLEFLVQQVIVAATKP